MCKEGYQLKDENKNVVKCEDKSDAGDDPEYDWSRDQSWSACIPGVFLPYLLHNTGLKGSTSTLGMFK